MAEKRNYKEMSIANKKELINEIIKEKRDKKKREKVIEMEKKG